jgi:hypothetical protein
MPASPPGLLVPSLPAPLPQASRPALKAIASAKVPRFIAISSLAARPAELEASLNRFGGQGPTHPTHPTAKGSTVIIPCSGAACPIGFVLTCPPRAETSRHREPPLRGRAQQTPLGWSVIVLNRHAWRQEGAAVGFGGREQAVCRGHGRAGGRILVGRVCKPSCLWRRQGRLRPVALVQAGPSGHVSGKSSCWRVGERRVTERW